MQRIQHSVSALRWSLSYISQRQTVRYNSSTSSAPPHKQPRTPSQVTVPVDDVCIPLEPPYSISSYIPSEPIRFSRDTLLKLHRLAALEPPAEDNEEAWRKLEQLGGLAAVIESVRSVDTRQLMLDTETSSRGTVLVDGRVRGEGVELERQHRQSPGSDEDDEAAYGRALLTLAQRTDGAYYTVPTPENIVGKRRSSKAREAQHED